MALAIHPTDKPFGKAMRDLIADTEWVTQTGNPNWHAFAEQLDGVHYETLRKALAGDRTVTPHIMEEVARALRIKPQHFAEYRLYMAAKSFDVREVGFERAMANFETWAATAAKTKRKR